MSQAERVKTGTRPCPVRLTLPLSRSLDPASCNSNEDRPLSPPHVEPGSNPANTPSEHLPPGESGGARLLFGRYALLVGADIASRGVRFLADILLGRHFGQAIFGQLNLAQSLAVQGIGVAGCGLDTSGVRHIAGAPASTPTIAATVVVLRLFLGLITWGALAAVARFVPQFQDTFELAALYGLSIFTGAVTLGWVAQARGRIDVVALAVLATNVSYFGGVYLTARLRWAPTNVPLVLIVAEIVIAAALWTWCCLRFGTISRPLPPAEAIKFFYESLPIGGANILRGLTLGSDVLLLGIFVSKADVGLYSSAFKLYSLGLSLIALYGSVLLPHLVTCAARSAPATRLTVHAALGRALLLAVPITLAGFLFSGAVLQVLFGPSFEAASRSLQVLLCALPIPLAATHFRTLLVVFGQQQRDLGLVAVSATVHIGVKLLLIPMAGITGAAWGTFAGETALLCLAWYAARPLLVDSGSRGRDGV